MRPDELAAATFGKAPARRRGYDEVAVDAFIDHAVADLRRGADPFRLGIEVRKVEFPRPTFGGSGYAMNQVDVLLDRLQQELTGEPVASDWHSTSHGRHLMTDTTQIRSTRQATRAARRRGRAAILQGAEPDQADRAATLAWAKWVRVARYGDPLSVVVCAILSLLIVASASVQIMKHGLSPLWLLATAVSVAWMALLTLALRVKLKVTAWLANQEPPRRNSGIDELLNE